MSTASKPRAAPPGSSPATPRPSRRSALLDDLGGTRTIKPPMTLPTVTSAVSRAPDAPLDLLGIMVFEEAFPDLPPAALPLVDPALAEILRRACADERFCAKAGQTLVLHTAGGLPARRIALAGAGSRARFAAADAQHVAAKLARVAASVGAHTMAISAGQAISGGPDEGLVLEALARGARLGAYKFDKYIADAKREPSPLTTVHLLHSPALADSTAQQALARAVHVTDAVAAARDLVNEPAGALTPTVLAQVASERARGAGVEATVLGPAECRARGMELFLAVARGSAEEPRFIHLTWRPPAATKRVVLVGKGVTFDSGGLSLKTNEGMLGMKADMAGAAAVLNAVVAAAEEHLPVEVHALCACTENMPSGTSYKLGDVIRSMSGKTVEINNTDAEGRLTLADAITYGLQLKPDVILDFATLTGACMVALGPHTAGVMTNDQRLADAWLAAATAAGEDMWPLPLPARLMKQLKSDVADMRNTGERWGGALTAGLFLKEFVDSTPWVHVDIAGPATADKEWGVYGKGATGFGVASILEYLRMVASPAGA
jgi:leucyl aminopeptidase